MICLKLLFIAKHALHAYMYKFNLSNTLFCMLLAYNFLCWKISVLTVILRCLHIGGNARLTGDVHCYYASAPVGWSY